VENHDPTAGSPTARPSVSHLLLPDFHSLCIVSVHVSEWCLKCLFERIFPGTIFPERRLNHIHETHMDDSFMQDTPSLSTCQPANAVDTKTSYLNRSLSTYVRRVAFPSTILQHHSPVRSSDTRNTPGFTLTQP